MGHHFQTDDFVLLGRGFDEYARMFRLDETTLRNASILDVAAGVSSFCAEANAQAYHVLASDRIYELSADEIERKCSRDLSNMLVQLAGITDNYVWDYIPTLDALSTKREQAYRTFVEDFRKYGSSRYKPTDYPNTGFVDGQFDLALVSHFLFLYDDQADYDFHRQTVLELLRIAREIRLFPLVNFRTERASAVTRLLVDPAFAPYVLTIERVDYEFIRNSGEMMVIRHA